MSTELAAVGLIGLAVMGENLALNMESRGFRVAVFNRTTVRVDEFVQGRAKDKKFFGAHDLKEFVANLRRPRKIVMLVKADAAVDQLIEQSLPLLESGDILIDGGNSLFTDTIRRTKRVEEAGKLYVGSGVSGGEEGALKGPSLMPGGSAAVWLHIKPIFEAIAARAPDGAPCTDWMGENGAGHFVKMVHSGIEYGDMQLICETYDVMKRVLGLSNAEMHEVLAIWNRAELDSYLIEITRDILGVVDKNGEAKIDVIVDAAGQKGTGKWTVIEALDHGVPLTLIGEAVFARALSAAKEERAEALKQLKPVVTPCQGDRQQHDIKPGQIKIIGVSHNHFDHLGQAAHFPHAKLIIGAEDWINIKNLPGSKALHAYLPERTAVQPWLDNEENVMPIVDDRDIFGDGSVVMLNTPGHTPGHHSLLVRLKDRGPILLTGDLYEWQENFETDAVPNNYTNRADQLASYDRFKKIARSLRATVIIQHEPADVAKIPAFPEWAR